MTLNQQFWHGLGGTTRCPFYLHLQVHAQSSLSCFLNLTGWCSLSLVRVSECVCRQLCTYVFREEKVKEEVESQILREYADNPRPSRPPGSKNFLVFLYSSPGPDTSRTWCRRTLGPCEFLTGKNSPHAKMSKVMM